MKMSQFFHPGFRPGQFRCDWGIYVILDEGISGRDHVAVTRAAIAGGARVVQLRDKKATFEEQIEIGRELRKITRLADVTLIVNDNPYLARELEADGVHIGQSDFPADIVREIVGPDKIVGLSTHTKQQAVTAQFMPVDYIGLGPVFETTTKKSEWAPVGTAMIRWVQKHVRLPIVAIGGITEERIVDVIAAGAQNAAIVGDLMRAPDIEAKTRRLVEAFEFAAKD